MEDHKSGDHNVKDQDRASGTGSDLFEDLEILTPRLVRAIDRALASIGPFGEVRIVKAKGRARFIQQLESRDLLGKETGQRDI